MILIDTSVLSIVFRRRRAGPFEERVRAACAALMAGDLQLGLPGIVLQEVLTGIASDEQFDLLRQKLLDGFAILTASGDDHVQAARLWNRCRANGLNVSGPDCLIAITAIAGEHQLLTIDADFSHLAGHSDLKLLRLDAIQ